MFITREILFNQGSFYLIRLQLQKIYERGNFTFLFLGKKKRWSISWEIVDKRKQLSYSMQLYKYHATHFGVVVDLWKCNNMEMSNKSGSYRVSSTSGKSHSCDEIYVLDQSEGSDLFSIIPSCGELISIYFDIRYVLTYYISSL